MLHSLLSSLALFAASSVQPAEDPVWLGCWGTEEGEVWLFEEGRAGHLPAEGKPRFYRAHRQPAEEGGAVHVWLETWARVTELELVPEGEGLRLRRGEEELLLSRLAGVPAGLLVPPYDLPDPVAVDEEMVAAVTEMLAERRAEDQRVRASGKVEDRSEMQRVDEDNTVFLLSLIRDIGWIDATRFGGEASDAAFLIVQHTSDLRLQRTALPFIEADVLAKRLDGQNFALLHDRLQLHLGYRQRYGSQIGITPDGAKVLMPCEDHERVDELRATLGMGPLAKYLALFESGDEPQPVRRMEEVVPIPPR